MAASKIGDHKACARAPVRVDPAGGGTDAPPFSTEHGGWVVNFAVNRYAFASAERLLPGEGILIYSLDLEEGVVADSVEDVSSRSPLEFLRAFITRLVPPEDSLLLVTEADAPAGSGLGGSGALGVAVVAAIDRAYGRQRSPVEIAALANEIERQDLGYPGGTQDSYGAALGGMNLLEHKRDGTTLPHDLRVKDVTSLSIEQASLLVYSGAAHVSGSIHDDIRHSYQQENSPTLQAMFQLREAAQTMAKALENGDVPLYTETLNTACESLYQLHPSCASDDHQRYTEALKDVIVARKTCGAGGGGFLLVHTRSGRRQECIRRVKQLGGLVWPVSIDAGGVTSWLAEATPPDEVERLRTLAVKK